MDLNRQYSIADFAKIKENCIFCQEKLQLLLVNFTQPREPGTYFGNHCCGEVSLKDGQFIFMVQHTASDYTVDTMATIDVASHHLVFTSTNDTPTPIIDQMLAASTLRNFDVHLELCCPAEKCGRNYYLDSGVLNFNFVESQLFWKIDPAPLFLESFSFDSSVVLNNHLAQTTHIYSSQDNYFSSISSPWIDFTSLDSDKLINRIKTIVIFS